MTDQMNVEGLSIAPGVMETIISVAASDGKLSVAVHVEVYYGYVLPELAAQLRAAIAEALATQAGVEVSSVDVYIDGLQFKA